MHIKKTNKKAVVPEKGTAAIMSTNNTHKAYLSGSFRENSQQNHQLQAGFLTCVYQKNPSHPEISNLKFEISKNSGTTSFGLATYIATNAYSGATVTDFNRVPYAPYQFHYT